MDDLNGVTVGQRMRRVSLTRQDVAIHFHRDAALAQSKLTHQLGYRDRLGKVARLSVNGHAHARKIDASPDLYNMGGIW